MVNNIRRECILFVSLFFVLTSCKRMLSTSYKGKDYFRLTKGYLSFADIRYTYDSVTNSNHSSCNEGDSCRVFPIYGLYSLVDTTTDMCLILHLEQQTFSTNWNSNAACDGSIEKMISLKFFIHGQGNIIEINEFNKNIGLNISCSENISDNGQYIVFSNGSWYPYEIPHCSREFPTTNIKGFLNLFNNESGKLDMINRYGFYFLFDKSIYKAVSFKPEFLELHIKMKDPDTSKSRIIKIRRNVNLSNIYTGR